MIKNIKQDAEFVCLSYESVCIHSCKTMLKCELMYFRVHLPGIFVCWVWVIVVSFAGYYKIQMTVHVKFNIAGSLW